MIVRCSRKSREVFLGCRTAFTSAVSVSLALPLDTLSCGMLISDSAAAPRRDALRVEEPWRRVDQDNPELTVIFNNLKYYTQPWVAPNKPPLRLLSADFDGREVICSPSEVSADDYWISEGHN